MKKNFVTKKRFSQAWNFHQEPHQHQISYRMREVRGVICFLEDKEMAHRNKLLKLVQGEQKQHL